MYRKPLIPVDATASEWLLSQRVEEIHLYEETLFFQKEYAKAKDLDTARIFKEEATWHRKRYNALLYIIPHYAVEPTKDCKGFVEAWYWPIDLSSEFDDILIQASTM